MDRIPQQSHIPFNEMESTERSDFSVKKEDEDLNKTEYFEYLNMFQKSKMKIYNRKWNQVKYTSVNSVIIKVDIKQVSLFMRNQFI